MDSAQENIVLHTSLKVSDGISIPQIPVWPVRYNLFVGRSTGVDRKFMVIYLNIEKKAEDELEVQTWRPQGKV